MPFPCVLCLELSSSYIMTSSQSLILYQHSISLFLNNQKDKEKDRLREVCVWELGAVAPQEAGKAEGSSKRLLKLPLPASSSPTVALSPPTHPSLFSNHLPQTVSLAPLPSKC